MVIYGMGAFDKLQACWPQLTLTETIGFIHYFLKWNVLKNKQFSFLKPFCFSSVFICFQPCCACATSPIAKKWHEYFSLVLQTFRRGSLLRQLSCPRLPARVCIVYTLWRDSVVEEKFAVKPKSFPSSSDGEVHYLSCSSCITRPLAKLLTPAF